MDQTDKTLLTQIQGFLYEPERFDVSGYLASELAKFDFRDPFAWRFQKGNYLKATQALEIVLQENPGHCLANELMANLLVILGDYTSAPPFYLKSFNPGDNSSVQLNLGALYEYLGKPEKSPDYYKSAFSNSALKLLASFMERFPWADIKDKPATLQEMRTWLSEQLDNLAPDKEPASVITSSPLDILKNLIKSKPACPVCHSTQTRFLFRDDINDRNIRHCSGCKVYYVYPQPTKEKISSWYGEKYFEPSMQAAVQNLDYWEKSMLEKKDIFHPTGKQFSLIFQWLESLGLKELEQTHNGTLKMLDVGCATAGLMAEFQTRGWETHGVELSRDAVEFDQSRGFNVQPGTLESAHYPEQSFDLITLTHVIEHLPDPLGTLTEIARVLKPGGKLFIRTPNAESLPALIFGKPWFSDHDHLFFFGNRSLTHLLQKCNFRVVGLKSYLGVDIETYNPQWRELRLNDLLRARINQANLGDVILLYAQYEGNS